MGIFSTLFGSKPKQMSTKTKGQRKLLDYLIEQLQSGGGIGDDPTFQGASDFLQQLFGGDFEAFEQPLIQQFEQQIAPGIAERFAGLGAGSSSGLNQALAQEAGNLTTKLGSQRANLMMQGLPQALSFGQAPMAQQLSLIQPSPFQGAAVGGTGGAFGSLSKMLMSRMGGGF